MMTKEYRNSYSPLVWVLTTVHIVLFGVLVWLSLALFDGGYITAWFVSLLVAVMALMMLSIPRKTVLTDDSVEIFCISDHTDIPYCEIVSVRELANRETRWLFPIFAAFGFFGYYGHYLNLRRMEAVKIYATRWRGLVEIVDIYDDKYYISCSDASDFISTVRERMAGRGGWQTA